jgi:hypothetical protein
VALTLRADGNKVAGTIRQGGLEDLQIENCKLDGERISFAATRSNGGRKMKMNFSGVVDGNEMKLERISRVPLLPDISSRYG